MLNFWKQLHAFVVNLKLIRQAITLPIVVSVFRDEKFITDLLVIHSQSSAQSIHNLRFIAFQNTDSSLAQLNKPI